MPPKAYSKYTSLSLGLVVFTFAILIMAAWAARASFLSQLPLEWRPIQFNTALMFAAAGLMIFTLSLLKMRVSAALAALIIVLPLLTLLEYFLHIDLHIDQAIVESYVSIGSASVLRMAPSTALCFIFCGLNGLLFSFTWFRRAGHFITGALVSFVAILALVSIGSYIFHFDSAYGWGNHSQMSLLSAICFLLETAALGTLLFAITDFNLRQRSSTLPVIVGTVLLIFSFGAWHMAASAEKEHIMIEMDARATIFKERARIFLDERLRALSRMALRSATSARPAEKAWRFDAQNYLRDMPGLRSLGMADRDSTIHWLEPPNPEAVGKKIAREPIRAQAVRHSAVTGETTVTHSIKLLDGKLGFIMLAPIKTPATPVDGFMLMTTDFNTFFNSLLDPQTPYDFQVYEINPKTSVLLFDRTSNRSMQSWKSDVEMHWKGVDWRISVSPHAELLQSLTSPTPVVTLLLGFIFSIFTSILVHLYLIAVKATKEAEAATEAKARFLANMSHEIRTPLNGVLGLSHLLKMTELTAQQDNYLNGIMSSAEALLALISDILDLSKIEAGKIRLEMIDFNLPQVVGDCLNLLGPAAAKKGLELDSKIDPFMPGWIKGDSFRLRQILLNLLSNAIKFTANGRVSLTIAVEKKIDNLYTICFEVVDSGQGIPPESLARLFGAFEQASRSTTRTHGGTGLGLSICKLLVEEMGGSIGVRSEVGRGSTFSFKIPYQLGVEQIIQNNLSLKTLEIPKGRHVLIAEDNQINQQIALAYLDHFGCKADVVSTGKEAIDALGLKSYDLVLMDVQMPEMDGFEATQLIRQQDLAGPRSIPIIAMTAEALEGDRDRCLAAGMNDYISKPVDPRELARLLAKWLVRKEN